MRILLVLTCLLAVSSLASEPSHASAPQCLGISQERQLDSTELPTALVRVRNECDNSFLVVYLECAWLNEGSDEGRGRGEIMNLAAGEVGDVRVVNWKAPQNYKDVQCKIESAVDTSG